jgi:Zn-finger nucleic acid-binding protein
MLILELEGIELDHCPACGGSWLDAGEMETIAEQAGARPGALARLLASAKAGDRGRRHCPRCRARLRLATVDAGTTGAPIEIDRCPRGHGLWLDRGEAARLIQAAEVADGDAEHRAVARFLAFMQGIEGCPAPAPDLK